MCKAVGLPITAPRQTMLAGSVLQMVTASQQGPPSVPARGTGSFEGDGLAAREAARNATSARGSWTVMGDGEWELNVSERERVVFYGSVVRL